LCSGSATADGIHEKKDDCEGEKDASPVEIVLCCATFEVVGRDDLFREYHGQDQQWDIEIEYNACEAGQGSAPLYLQKTSR
jgi:hypothetical protein